MARRLVRRLVLVAPFGLYDKGSPPLDLWGQKPGALPGMISAKPEAFAAFTAPPEGIAPAEWSIQMNRANEAAARLLWPLSDTRLERRLHRIRCATLVVWGAADRVLSPSYAERFAARITGKTRTTIIPGAGHLADFDAPEAVAEAVLSALAPGEC